LSSSYHSARALAERFGIAYEPWNFQKGDLFEARGVFSENSTKIKGLEL
jgi:hypothetical protein